MRAMIRMRWPSIFGTTSALTVSLASPVRNERKEHFLTFNANRQMHSSEMPSATGYLPATRTSAQRTAGEVPHSLSTT